MLSEEEKKAIERLEKRIKDNEDYKTTQVWLTDDVSAVYTVLNMIKKKDKSIEIQKDNYKNLTEDISKIAKELGLEEDGTIDEIFAEIEKKDKIIDLMAEDWFFKEGYKLQIYIQRNRTDDRIFRKKRIYTQSV